MLETPQPMYLIWGECKTFLFNDHFAPLLGPKAIEALGKPLETLWSPAWDDISQFVLQAYRGIGCLAEDVPLRTWASGFSETRYFTFSYTPVRDPEGAVCGAAGICTDTTEGVLARRQAVAERDNLLRLFEQAPGFVAITEGPEHRVTFSNQAYRDLTAGRAVVGSKIADAVPEAVDQGFIELLDRVFTSAEPFKAIDVPVMLKNRESSDLEQHFVTFLYEPLKDEDGKVTGLFLQGNVVTKEKVAQQKVERLQSQLIELSRASAMHAMASTLAHELNQPLTTIANYVSGMEKAVAKGCPSSELANPLNAVRDSVHRAGRVIRSLRSMIKGKKGHYQAHLLEPLIDETLHLISVGRPESVVIAHTCSAELTFTGDPVQIQQLIMNLVINAIEAAAERKPPRIEITAVPCGQERVQISVRDNGPGFPADALAIPFQTFSSTKPEGMGLGLSICRTIVEAHGGRIELRNGEGGGAEVRFTLPSGTPHETAPMPQAGG